MTSIVISKGYSFPGDVLSVCESFFLHTPMFLKQLVISRIDSYLSSFHLLYLRRSVQLKLKLPWYIPLSICSFLLGISWFLQVDHCSLHFFIERNFSFAVRFFFCFWQSPNIALEHSWQLHPNDNLLMLVCSTGMKMCSLVFEWIWLL